LCARGALCAHDRNERVTGTVFDYGTAGFRTLASRLDAVAFRAGAVAAARSAACGGAATGLVITARRF
jgi:phosphoacetylglucosamine mutase